MRDHVNTFRILNVDPMSVLYEIHIMGIIFQGTILCQGIDMRPSIRVYIEFEFI